MIYNSDGISVFMYSVVIDVNAPHLFEFTAELNTFGPISLFSFIDFNLRPNVNSNKINQ